MLSEQIKDVTRELSQVKNELITMNNMLRTLIENKPAVIPTEGSKTALKESRVTLKACYQTLEIIKQFEREHQRGVTADEIALIRNLSRPAIYAHLEELEQSNLVTSKRGSVLDLKPYNSKFYYMTERDPYNTLWDHNLFSSLPHESQLVSRKLLNTLPMKPEGLTVEEIADGLTINEKTIKKDLIVLLRRALIDFNTHDLEIRYFVPKI
ncbi:MAG: hypothetical protein ACXADA_14690 [Candidatus Hodarchaeales archaeon]